MGSGRDVLILLLLAWNVVSCIVMGMDKWASKGEGRRVSESTLFMMAFSFGAPGIGLGMLLFRHKTKKVSFAFLIPLALLVNTILIIGIFQLVA